MMNDDDFEEADVLGEVAYDDQDPMTDEQMLNAESDTEFDGFDARD